MAVVMSMSATKSGGEGNKMSDKTIGEENDGTQNDNRDVETIE